jgi:hypothetical protein
MAPKDELRCFVALALTDGQLSARELQWLLGLAAGLGIPAERAAELLHEQERDERLPTLPAEPAERSALLRRLEELAAVDGVAAEELALLRHLWEAARRLDAAAQGPRLGPYVLLEALGAGSTATVHRARHQVHGVEVAIKLLHRAAATPSARLRSCTRPA